jgi:hemoglobin
MFTELSQPAIGVLVETFYARVRRHPALGPVFNQAIVETAWPAHLVRMTRFWSSVMLTAGLYKGDPVAAHKRAMVVAPFTPELFSTWLDLFEATAADLFAPALAMSFAAKARRIAESLKLALFFRPDRPWAEDLRRREVLTGAPR